MISLFCDDALSSPLRASLSSSIVISFSQSPCSLASSCGILFLLKKILKAGLRDHVAD